MRLLLIFSFLVVADMAYAYKPDKCFKFVHSGGMRKYDYPGNLSQEYMTKKYGSTYGPTEASQQTFTASVDPFVWAGRLTSSSQFSTSWGACDYFALKKELRKEYIAKNKEPLNQEVAMGRGEHLKAIHFYSSCEVDTMNAFQVQMQKNYAYLNAQMKKSPKALDNSIDLIILQDSELRNNCQVI
jgi:hypothetical protein